MKACSMFLLALVAAGCATTTEMEPVNVPPELNTAVPALLQAWRGTNAAAFEPLFAGNIVVTTPSDRYSGWHEVRSRWLAGLPNMSNFQTTNHTFTREGSDIIESGQYSFTMTQDGQAHTMRGSFAQRWQRQADGSWKVVSVSVQ